MDGVSKFPDNGDRRINELLSKFFHINHFSEPLFEEAFSIYYNTSIIVLNDDEGTNKSAATRFDRASIPEKIDPQYWWYIVIAIVFGGIVLFVIIFILYKVSLNF